MNDDKIKGALRSKMMMLGIATTLLGAAFEFLPNVQELIGPKYYGVVLMAVGVGVKVLRWVTTQPLEDK